MSVHLKQKTAALMPVLTHESELEGSTSTAMKANVNNPFITLLLNQPIETIKGIYLPR